MLIIGETNPRPWVSDESGTSGVGDSVGDADGAGVGSDDSPEGDVGVSEGDVGVSDGSGSTDGDGSSDGVVVGSVGVGSSDGAAVGSGVGV